jgi:DNA-binding transcriptional LysR family regulator
MDLAVVVESEICDQFDKHVVKKGFFHIYAKKGLQDNLKNGVYVDHANGLHVDKLQNSIRKRYKKELPILQELDSWQVLAKCAENGIGHCFLPDFIAEGYPLLVASEDLQGIPYRIVIIHPKGVHLTRAAKLFVSLL